MFVFIIVFLKIHAVKCNPPVLSNKHSFLINYLQKLNKQFKFNSGKLAYIKLAKKNERITQQECVYYQSRQARKKLQRHLRFHGIFLRLWYTRVVSTIWHHYSLFGLYTAVGTNAEEEEEKMCKERIRVFHIRRQTESITSDRRPCLKKIFSHFQLKAAGVVRCNCFLLFFITEPARSPPHSHPAALSLPATVCLQLVPAHFLMLIGTVSAIDDLACRQNSFSVSHSLSYSHCLLQWFLISIEIYQDYFCYKLGLFRKKNCRHHYNYLAYLKKKHHHTLIGIQLK